MRNLFLNLEAIYAVLFTHIFIKLAKVFRIISLIFDKVSTAKLSQISLIIINFYY